MRQKGAALLVMLAIVGLAGSWMLVDRLNAETGGIEAARKKRNAEVLNRAKLALIGYVIAQAAKSGEDSPGAIPCPEADGNFDSTTNDGQSASTCTLPRVGRFPWRTIGTDKLVDASGEPLWLVVSPGWARQAGNTVINSNSAGQLTVDGVANAAVALVIAPGPAFSAAAAAGCAAKNQARVIAGPPDIANYLECDNATAADGSFVTTGPSGSFNDQVLTVTAAEILPGIEAAIAARIENEVAPALRSLYSGGSWSGSSSAPALPWAAAFSDPTTSAMKGASGTLQGLLPLTNAETSPGSGVLCTAGAGAPRCDPAFVVWASSNMVGSASTYNEICTTTASAITCTFYYRECLFAPFWCAATTQVPFTVNATANNVGRAMRQLRAAAVTTYAGSNVSSITSLSGVLNSNSSASLAISGQASVSGSGSLLGDLICSLTDWLDQILYDCRQGSVTIPITVLSDHPLLDSTTTGAGALGWFMRNKWHEVSYYAIAAGFAPNGARSCTTGSTCLTLSNHRNAAGADDAGKQRALIALPGRSLGGAARPNGNLADWLEGANADGASPFEVRSATLLANQTFNDRFAVLSSNP